MLTINQRLAARRPPEANKLAGQDSKRPLA